MCLIFMKYKMLIESTDYSMKNITNNVIYCSGRDVRTAKNVVKYVKKTKTFIVNTWGGDE